MDDLSLLFIQFLNGLSHAMILFIIASGLTIIFGVLRVINFAHGSFYMLGAYISYSLTKLLSGALFNFWLTLICSATIVSLIGWVVEWSLLRRVYKREHLYQLLLTYALVLVIADTVKRIWTEELRIVPLPSGLEGALSIFGHPFPRYHLLFILPLGLLVAVGLWILLNRTRYGRVIRASSSDKEMVSALGWNSSRLFTLVFAMGTWLGGLGGAVMAPTVRLSTEMDVEIIIEAFTVVIIGGLGSIWGALLGAIVAGELNAFGILLWPPGAMAFIFILVAIILIVKPYGLLGKPVR